MDLSGPHEGTPQPGQRIHSNQAHYFLVLTVKLEIDEPPGDPPAQPRAAEDEDEHPPPLHIDNEDDGDAVPEKFLKPIIYEALLAKKSDAASKIQELLALVKSQFGHLPEAMIYRLHSDLGTEFMNENLGEYLRFHGIAHSTTQGYDPSANGSAETAVGLLKRRGRYLLTGNRFPTRWWGVCVLGAAYLFRVECRRRRTSSHTIWHTCHGKCGSNSK